MEVFLCFENGIYFVMLEFLVVVYCFFVLFDIVIVIVMFFNLNFE